MNEKEFCEFYTAIYGEKIDKIGQLASVTYTGEQLLEDINLAMKWSAEKQSEEVATTVWNDFVARPHNKGKDYNFSYVNLRDSIKNTIKSLLKKEK